MQNTRTVVIIEDREIQRETLKKLLKRRGFNVEAAGDVESARKLLKSFAGTISVMVLDNRLEDTEHPEITGPDLAIEFVENRKQKWRPECLILSAHAKVEYYKLALKLGAAAYLEKETDQAFESTIRHVRALQLRHEFSIENPETEVIMRLLVRKSKSREDVVTRFCKEVMVPKFKEYLGTPFALFLSRDNQVRFSGGDFTGTGYSLFDGKPSPAFEKMQALALWDLQDGRVSTLNLASAPASFLPDDQREFLKPLDQAAFIHLTLDQGFRLSLAILQADRQLMPLAEDPKEMAKVLADYFSSAALTYTLKIMADWNQAVAELERRKSQTEAAIGFSFFIGQQQITLLDEAVKSGELNKESQSYKDLRALAANLQDTGTYLQWTSFNLSERIAFLADIPVIPVKQKIELLINELKKYLPNGMVKINGEECRARIKEDDLEVIISRILLWFGQRFEETHADNKPGINLTCNPSDDDTAVKFVFEDYSFRLPVPIRECLFLPFSQAASDSPAIGSIPGSYMPLFLAKTIVEMKYGGTLEDCTDQREDKIGHRFVITLPRRENVEV